MSAHQALLHLLFLAIMVLLLVGGPVAILILWWVRGRDPAVGPVVAYLTEPPGDLSPGAAGTLIDEHADHHDVLATLLGLGRHGAVRITQVAGRKPATKDYQIEVIDPACITSGLERAVVRALFAREPAKGDRVRLSGVRDRFRKAEPLVRDALYQELVERGYFLRSPAATRKRWQRLSLASLALSVVAGVWLGVALDPYAFLAMAAAIIISLVLLRVSRSMPQKTFAGAEAAARWRAFRQYLKDIDKYERLDEARGLFDRYLAYAVAFELDKQWVQRFAAAGAARPGWFRPAERPGADAGDIGDVAFTAARAGESFGDVGRVSMPGNLDLPDVGMPDLSGIDLQGFSDAIGGGLQGASDAFSGLLDVAGSIFDAIDIDINS
ncbi:MAG: DUF2207 domain-containing protein [Thermomicrobiales bacterium]